jgi:hypothetical protein
MMFMISGRAVNASGAPIVRDGVVAAIHGAGHSVVTAQPRRGSFSYVDYLVATRDSITRRVTKVRWAATRNIPVIDYTQLWNLINNDIQPSIRELPADTAVPHPTRREAAATRGETVARREREVARTERAAQDERDVERLRRAALEEARAIQARAIEENRVQQRADMEVEVIQVDDTPKEPVIGKPRRRRIVTGR